jgi:type III pantothenate kinase
MKLLVDVGNTRVKLAVLENNAPRLVAAVPTHDAELMRQALDEQLTNLGVIESAWGVCVGHLAVAQGVEAALPPNLTMQWVQSTAKAAGVVNRYPEPHQLGADRWVGVIGLTRHFQFDGGQGASAVLVNFGTATTIDTLGPDKAFRGGLILPGVAMMQSALAQGTARLPQASGEVVDNPISTASAIASGIAAAQIGAVKRQLEIAQRDDRQTPLLCVSGGAYENIQAALQHSLMGVPIHHLPLVVLDGLAILAQETKHTRG